MTLTTTTVADALSFLQRLSQSTWADWDDVAWYAPGEQTNFLTSADIEVWALSFGDIIA